MTLFRKTQVSQPIHFSFKTHPVFDELENVGRMSTPPPSLRLGTATVHLTDRRATHVLLNGETLSGRLGIPDSPPQHDSSPGPYGCRVNHIKSAVAYLIESSRSAQGARNTYSHAVGIASLFVDRVYFATTGNL